MCTRAGRPMLSEKSHQPNYSIPCKMATVSAYKSLEDFLANKKTFDKTKYTHVGMGPEGSVHQGKYMINDHEYPMLLKHIVKHCFVDEKPYNLLEKHKDIGPVLIDLDFRYDVPEDAIPPEGKTVKEKKARNEAIKKLCYRRYTSEMIDEFVHAYACIIDKYYDISQLESLTFYIMEKPAPTFDSKQKKVKDGIHIVISDLITTPEIQKALRLAALDEHIIATAFAETELGNSEDDIFDHRVIKSNNWFMYGASKPDQPAYLLNRKIVLTDGSLEESDDFEDHEELLKILSLRYEKVETTLVSKDETLDEWTAIMNKANGVILKADLVTSEPAIKIIKRRAPGVDNPTAAIDFGDGVAFEEGDEFESILSPYANKEEINTVMRLAVECLSEARANNYSQWMDVGFCLHNICAPALFDTWVEFSRKSTKFDADALAHMRQEWPRMTNRGLKLGSLHMWAKSDNPGEYDKIMADDIIREIERTMECSHTAIAKITHRVFKHRFCCGSFKERHWFEFKENRWCKLDDGITLRQQLSEKIKDLYLEAEARIIQRQKALPAESDENAKLAAKKKILAEINKKLGMRGFKDDVMRECQEVFYRDKFMQELNTNPYLLVCKNKVLELRGRKKVGGKDTIGIVVRNGQPDDMMSYSTGLNYNPKLCDPKNPYYEAVMDFFSKLFPIEDEREYMLTLLASCLEGTNREQKFYIMTGVGSNGKSQLVRLINKTFSADYASTLSTTALTRKKADSGAANPDLIGIKGKRFISMNEPDAREAINTATMKQLSGEDEVAARALYGDQEYITIMGKIFMACNDMPAVPTTDWGTWRRIRVLRFRARFTDDPNPDPDAFEFLKDETLNDKMMDWRETFLAILVHYYETSYLRYGLREPDSVKEESKRYQEENDQFANFLKENISSGKDETVRLSELWTRYKEWNGKQRGSSYRMLKQDAFRLRMKSQYGDIDPKTQCFRGIRLIRDDEMGGMTDISGGAV